MREYEKSSREKLRFQSRIEELDNRENEKQRKRMGEPVRFTAPHAGLKKENRKSGQDEENGITLMKLSNRFGQQEIKRGPDGGKTSFTATVHSPEEAGGLREDMRHFDRNTAKKQRRTADADLFLAGGGSENAASVEFEQSRKWTDSRMKLLRGEGRSSVLEAACPYAEDAGERQRLAIVREQLEQARRQAAEIQREGPDGGGNKTGRLEELRRQESELAAKAEALTQMIGKKDYLKRIMLQKFIYATEPAGETGFFARIRGNKNLNPLQEESEGEIEQDMDEQPGDAAEDEVVE